MVDTDHERSYSVLDYLYVNSSLLCLGHHRGFSDLHVFLFSFPPKQDTRSVHEEKISNLGYIPMLRLFGLFHPFKDSDFCKFHWLLKVFFTTGIHWEDH